MLKELITGSVAAKHWFPDFRKSKDIDIISKSRKSTKFGEEVHWVEAFQYIFDNNLDSTFVDPNFLFTLKVSHAEWNIHWDKTICDIRFLQEKGCKLDRKLYDLLIPEWENKHGKKKVNLNVGNEYFFNENVTRQIDHDQLHEIFKFYDKPLHTRIRKDINRALPSEELFNQLSREDQIKCALEEIYVIATERYVKKYPKKHAKYQAMKNLITTMTKGWFCHFLVVNFKELYYNDLDKYFWEVRLNEHINIR